MSTTKQNPNDVFWLARYAHNQAAPLFEQAKVVEPTLSFSIEINFSEPGSRFFEDHAISINAWWARDGMFQMSPRLQSREDVDRFAAKLTADVAALVPVEVAA